jgi:photosystem II stability/assembly factor-like uncharacterized protein
MRKIGIILAITFLGTGLGWGQYGYQYLSGGYWSQSQFIGQEGWMVGTTGQVAHTRDGGKNWVSQMVRSPWFYDHPDLGGVYFLDQRHGWVCADEAPYIWRTSNGGIYWDTITISYAWPGFAKKIAFADTLHGWLVSGRTGLSNGVRMGDVRATTDGGRSWVTQDTSRAWFGVWAGTPSKSWVVGHEGWIGCTTDGGMTWIQQQIPPLKTLFNVFLRDTLFGWACGDSGTIVFTPDGGVSWTFQASGTTRELVGITFLDRRRGFAVGDTGILLSTTDGGTTWTTVPTGVSVALTTLSFGDSLHGWAIGEGGTTLETLDGGQTWRVTRQGTTERIQAVSFVDDQTGWASSWEGNIWHTIDGGMNWIKQFSVSPKRLRGLTMANALKGWAVGDSGLVLATQNGGTTWAPQASGTQRNLWNVFEGDAQHAWACGAGRTIAQTSNGGGSWNTFSVTWPDSGITGLASVDTLYGWALFWDGNVWATTNSGRGWSSRGKIGSMGWRHLSFVDPDWGWAVGDSGIVRSTDGGRTWQNQGAAYRLKDVAGMTQSKAWAVGDSGRVLATSDGGATWFPQTSLIAESLFSVSFADTLHGIAGADGGHILVTRNGGAAWDTVRLGWWENRDVFLVDSLEGWNAGGYRTTDGGYTWQYRGGGFGGVAVHFANRDTGWIATGGGYIYDYIYRTTDRGNTWDTVRTWAYEGLKDIRLATGRIGWCGIAAPSPYYNTNGLKVTLDRGNGNIWSSLSERRVDAMSFKTGGTLTSTSSCFVGEGSLTLRAYHDLSWDISPMFADTHYQVNRYIPVHWGFSSGDGRTGWAAGRCGSRVITTDGGLSWRLQKLSRTTDSLITSIHVFDGLTARGVGYLGNSVYTTDGGATWEGDEPGTHKWLLASSFLTPTLGWVAGENGMVLKYGRLPSGVEDEKTQTGIPGFTWLGQNRPNPFSGGTEIRYQLANKGKVRLVVYNILGQGVRRVVDKQQEAGAYMATWDGRDGTGGIVSSGVYFYRLEAGGKSQTRKMVKVR